MVDDRLNTERCSAGGRDLASALRRRVRPWDARPNGCGVCREIDDAPDGPKGRTCRLCSSSHELRTASPSCCTDASFSASSPPAQALKHPNRPALIPRSAGRSPLGHRPPAPCGHWVVAAFCHDASWARDPVRSALDVSRAWRRGAARQSAASSGNHSATRSELCSVRWTRQEPPGVAEEAERRGRPVLRASFRCACLLSDDGGFTRRGDSPDAFREGAEHRTRANR